MSVALIVAVLSVAAANGANDIFKGVATLHGAGALTYRRALAWALGCTAAGGVAAVLLPGTLAARFSGAGLVGASLASEPSFLLAVAGAAALTVAIAARAGLPISTTHALTGALLGAGMVMAGPGSLRYGTLARSFVLPLVLGPLVAALLAAVLASLARVWERRAGSAEGTCVCVVATGVPVVVGAGLAHARGGLVLEVDRVSECARHGARGVELGRLRDRLHLLSAGALSLARGLNDTPKIAVLALGSGVTSLSGAELLVALAMAAGGLVGAARVARTMAFDVTTLDRGSGLTANAAAALLVTLASPLGLPVSTTHVACGALFGQGASSGDLRSSGVRTIALAWVGTLPLAAGLAAALAGLARAL